MSENKAHTSFINMLSGAWAWFLLLLFSPALIFLFQHWKNNDSSPQHEKKPDTTYWRPAALYIKGVEPSNYLAEYGRDLIAHTSKYLGPKGSIASISNGMNCQNCHLDAGTKIFGNNYGSVASLYPKFRARSGTVENIYKRINDCIERSLNGQALDTNSREMQAIKTYIERIGSNISKGEKAKGSGLKDIEFLSRAADPVKGLVAYNIHCVSCHMSDGQGKMNDIGNEYLYPPLWGRFSYNDGAGLYRLSNFAKYIKYNMPFGVDHSKSTLTLEEAWDLAAYVNSKPRPHIDVPADWPDISKKPIDHPFGPYKDNFSEKQHKFGPYGPIQAFYKNIEKK